jgi:hypothetical protein
VAKKTNPPVAAEAPPAGKDAAESTGTGDERSTPEKRPARRKTRSAPPRISDVDVQSILVYLDRDERSGYRYLLKECFD